MTTLLINIGLCASKVEGTEGTGSSQVGASSPFINPGLRGAIVENMSACRAAISTYNIPHGIPHIKNIECNVPEHLNVYKRYVPSSTPPTPYIPLPIFSGTSDMLAYINAMALGVQDIGASILGELTASEVQAFIMGWARSSPYDLSAVIYGIVDWQSDLYSSIRGWVSAFTEPVVYEESIIATPKGITILRRVLTLLPDITASIYGWEHSDLAATMKIISRKTLDLYANIGSIEFLSSYLYASIISTYIEDITGELVVVEASDLNSYLNTIPPKDLPTLLIPVPPKDLHAFGGGHLPKDLSASLLINQPFPLLAWIRVGLNGEDSLYGEIVGTGGWLNITASVEAAFFDNVELYASITSRIPIDLRTYISGWAHTNLLASVIGVHGNDIGAWVTPLHVGNYKDMPSFTRASWNGIPDDLETSIHGWISTHTTDKVYNYNLYNIFPRRILLGQPRGLSFVRLEPVRGYFPDLHASIIVTQLTTSYLKAYVNPTYPINSNVSAVVNAVTRTIHIDRIIINMVNVSDLTVFISAFSGYKPLYASIRGKASVHTSTSANAKWVSVSSTVRFYIGTTRGLYIPERRVNEIRYINFLNYSTMPDMHAYLFGWAADDLTAYISVQPYMHMSGYVNCLDLSHTKGLIASITSVYTKNLLASISGVGYYNEFYASISSLGGVNDLSASIKPYLKIFGYRIIGVETMPFLDLYAVVNPIFACGYITTYSSFSAFIRCGTVVEEGGSNLYAEIYSNTDVKDLSSSVIGRKLTRLRILNLYFRTLTRSNSAFTASIIGVGKGEYGLGAYIKGLSHENDFGASITAVNYFINVMDPLGLIDVYKERTNGTAYLYKRLKLFFSNHVDEYVYDSLNDALYTIGEGRWVLNLTEFTEVLSFYDRSPSDRNRDLDSIMEYSSVDEAIRAAIVFLTEFRTMDLTASIVATGGYSKLYAEIAGIYHDRVSDLRAAVTIVTNLPDLYASISAFSGYRHLYSSIVGYASSAPELLANIYGVVHESLTANITCVV